MLHLRKPGRISVLLSVMIGLVMISSVSAGWDRIGFGGKEIRALATGLDIMRDRQVVYVPVDDSGVFMVSGQDDSMYLFPYDNFPNDRPAGKVRSLLVTENGATVMAGSDSGFYSATIYSAALPIWRKTMFSSTEPVIGIAKSDSAFCAITASGVYRSKGVFGTWQPCSLSGNPLRPASGSVFTAVTSWPTGKAFVVGSATVASDPAGGHVIFGSISAQSWTDAACIPGCTCVDAVYSLVADSQVTLYAGTSKGVFHSVDFDTGCWHSRPPQLEIPIRDMCLARMNATGMPPDVYVATDSGVYLKSIQTTASGAWNRLLSLKTFAVEVLDVSGDMVIYAGTGDGLWRYSPSTTIAARRNKTLQQSPAGQAARYSLDGRVVPQNDRKVYRGVYIVKGGTQKRGESRLRCVVR